MMHGCAMMHGRGRNGETDERNSDTARHKRETHTYERRREKTTTNKETEGDTQ